MADKKKKTLDEIFSKPLKVNKKKKTLDEIFSKPLKVNTQSSPIDKSFATTASIGLPRESISQTDVQNRVSSFIKTAKQEALPLAGGVAGTVAGAFTPIPGGAAVGNIIGMGIGEAVSQGLGMSSEPFGSLQGQTQIAEQMLTAGVTEATFGAGRLGIKALIPKVEAFVASIIGREATTSGLQAAKTFRAAGGELPAKMIAEPTLNKIERINVQISKNKINNFTKDFTNNIDSVLPRQELGSLFVDTVTKGKVAWKALSTAAFEKIKKDTTRFGIKVNINKILSSAQEISFRSAQIADFGLEPKVAQSAKKFFRLEKNITPTLEGEMVISFADAIDIKTALGRISRQFKKAEKISPGTVNQKAKFQINKMLSEISQAMDTTVTNVGKTLKNNFKDANKLVTDRIDIFENDLVKKLVNKTRPEMIADELFKAGDVSTPIAVKKAIFAAGEKTTLVNPNHVWNQVQGNYLRLTLGNEALVDGTIDASKVISKITGKGADTLQTVMGKESAQNFTRVVEAVKLQQDSIINKTLSPLLRIRTKNATLTGFFSGSLSFFMTATMLNRVFQSKTMTNFLVKGLSNVATEKTQVSFLREFSKALLKTGITIKEMQLAQEFNLSLSAPDTGAPERLTNFTPQSQ